ncbi:MAG: glycosyltransferase, partial [Pseudomonadota bacterium]
HEKFYFRDRDTCRDKLGLPKDRRIILFAGNFQVEKGLGYLVEAYAKLAPSQPDTDLYVIGSGPLEDQIQQQVERLGIRDRVNFVGRVLHESMPDYLGAADFLSLPSLREGCPNTVLETLACGTPVIASRVGAVPEMLYKDHYGLMAEPANAESLYQALKTACEREWPVLNDFEWMSWEENAQQVSKVFEQVMQQTGGNPARAAASAA